MPDAQWVDAAANVFSAVGTVGAFAIGFVLLRQEHKREEVRAEEDRRSQAVQVSAWIEAQPTARGGRELQFHVHNASDSPIYEVSLPMLVPTEDQHEAEFIGLVPPGRTITRLAPREWLKTYFSPEPVQLEFLDSSGQQWTRDEQGFLTLASDAPSPERVRRLRGPRRLRLPGGARLAQLARWSGERRRPDRNGSGSP